MNNYLDPTTNKLPKTILNALALVNPILAKAEADPEAVTHAERLQLLYNYKCSYHTSGKIENILSLDSSCHGCSFCASMREAARINPEIICGECYDHKFESFRPGQMYRHILNLRIMSSVLFTVEELSILPAAEIVRINSSGDIENVIHARNMIRYAKAHPAASVAMWAKNIKDVITAFDIEGKPDNMTFVVSSYSINKPSILPRYADYVFTVYNDAAAVEDAINSGACECNGKKCKECGFKCYLRIWAAGSNIAELLRK